MGMFQFKSIERGEGHRRTFEQGHTIGYTLLVCRCCGRTELKSAQVVCQCTVDVEQTAVMYVLVYLSWALLRSGPTAAFHRIMVSGPSLLPRAPVFFGNALLFARLVFQPEGFLLRSLSSCFWAHSSGCALLACLFRLDKFAKQEVQLLTKHMTCLGLPSCFVVV